MIFFKEHNLRTHQTHEWGWTDLIHLYITDDGWILEAPGLATLFSLNPFFTFELLW
jgi:hypothetical protein